MSLFGCDGAVESDLPPENDVPVSTTPPARIASSPSASPDVKETRNIHPDAQNHAQEVSYPKYDADDGDDDDDNDLPNSSETEEPFPHARHASRPNRFTGKSSTWRGYTAADRNIATSLDQQQAADLAAHLYNAHALKRRVRLPVDELRGIKNWQSKDTWMKKGRDLEFVDVVGERQMELVPSKRWTAWPLPVGEGRVMDGGRADGGCSAGEDARAEVLACFLRIAKERFLSREAEDHIEGLPSRRRRLTSNPKEAGGPQVKRRRLKSASRPGSRSATSGPSDDGGESEDREQNEMAGGEEEAEEEEEEEEEEAPALRSKEQNSIELGMRPIVAADDEASYRVLQPTINSLLARVDHLAAGIRRTRMNHFGRGAASDTSGSEATSGAETDGPTTRSRSRSRSNSASAAKKSASRASSRAPRPSKPKQAWRKRRQRRQRDDDSDSASDYGAEFASDSNSAISSASRSSSITTLNREASVQVGLLDWSEVLGIASTTGSFSPSAIARTAQRCASLFDEGTQFRVFDESLATLKPNPQPVSYTPSTIPAPPAARLTDARNDPKNRNRKRPYFDTGTLRCPHPDCKHHAEGTFEISYRVIQHVIRTHGYDPRTNDSDNEERKVGGVHVDGFLMPVTAKQGWLGRGQGRSKSKSVPRVVKRRSKKAKAAESEQAEIYVVRDASGGDGGVAAEGSAIEVTGERSERGRDSIE